MPPLVRPALPDELDAVGALTEDAYRSAGYLDPPNDSDHGYAKELRDAASRAEAAELMVSADGPHLLGTVTWCYGGSPFCELATRPDQGEIRMLAVASPAQRRGVGRQLAQWCLDRARATGLREVVLCSMAAMTGAHALYDRLGFERSPELDWMPTPQIELLGFRLELATSPAADAVSAHGQETSP